MNLQRCINNKHEYTVIINTTKEIIKYCTVCGTLTKNNTVYESEVTEEMLRDEDNYIKGFFIGNACT
jgi:hypothetical protein